MRRRGRSALPLEEHHFTRHTLNNLKARPVCLFAPAFFANARTYILCGTEPIGAVPDVNTIPPDELSATLANLRTSLESVLSWSFFITKNMKTDLTRTRLNGTLPLLYVF